MLVLVAAVVHAGWNRVLHAEADRVAAMAVAGLVIGVVLLPGIVISPPWVVLPLVLASAGTHVAYALGLSAAYRRGALSRLPARYRNQHQSDGERDRPDQRLPVRRLGEEDPPSECHQQRRDATPQGVGH